MVASARGSGGTWAGACENLEASWVPLWVKRADGPVSGNAELVAKGARWMSGLPESVGELVAEAGAGPGAAPAGVAEETGAWKAPSPERIADTGQKTGPPEIPEGLDFFQLFLARLAVLSAGEPLPEAAIAERLEVAKGQAKRWLKRGVAEGRVEKLTRPVRYRAPHRERVLPLDTSIPGETTTAGAEDLTASIPSGLDFHDLFLARLEELTMDEPRSSAFLARALRVAPGQVNAWLRRGVARDAIRRTRNPVRYSRPV